MENQSLVHQEMKFSHNIMCRMKLATSAIYIYMAPKYKHAAVATQPLLSEDTLVLVTTI